MTLSLSEAGPGRFGRQTSTIPYTKIKLGKRFNGELFRLYGTRSRVNDTFSCVKTLTSRPGCAFTPPRVI